MAGQLYRRGVASSAEAHAAPARLALSRGVLKRTGSSLHVSRSCRMPPRHHCRRASVHRPIADELLQRGSREFVPTARIGWACSSSLFNPNNAEGRLDQVIPSSQWIHRQPRTTDQLPIIQLLGSWRLLPRCSCRAAAADNRHFAFAVVISCRCADASQQLRDRAQLQEEHEEGN